MQEKDKPNSKRCYSLVFVFTPQLDKLVLLTNRIWLRSEGIVALVKIKALRHGGLLNGPGGRLETGETLLQCAAREFQKETGFKLNTRHLPEVLTLQCYCDGEIHSLTVFAAIVFEKLILEGTPEKPAQLYGLEQARPRMAPTVWELVQLCLTRLKQGGW